MSKVRRRLSAAVASAAAAASASAAPPYAVYAASPRSAFSASDASSSRVQRGQLLAPTAAASPRKTDADSADRDACESLYRLSVARASDSVLLCDIAEGRMAASDQRVVSEAAIRERWRRGREDAAVDALQRRGASCLGVSLQSVAGVAAPTPRTTFLTDGTAVRVGCVPLSALRAHHRGADVRRMVRDSREAFDAAMALAQGAAGLTLEERISQSHRRQKDADRSLALRVSDLRRSRARRIIAAWLRPIASWRRRRRLLARRVSARAIQQFWRGFVIRRARAAELAARVTKLRRSAAVGRPPHPRCPRPIIFAADTRSRGESAAG
jgi:hypothetical protein